MVERGTVRPRHTSSTFEPVLYEPRKSITYRGRGATRGLPTNDTRELATEKKRYAGLPARVSKMNVCDMVYF